MIKLFELSVSARKASVEMNMSYKTTLKAFNILRKAIAEELSKCDDILKGEIELDPNESNALFVPGIGIVGI